MEESKPNTVSVKVSKQTYEELNDEQTRIRKATGHKPTFTELLDEAWREFQKKSADSTMPASLSMLDVIEVTSPEYRECEDLLQVVLGSGSPVTINICKYLLRALAESSEGRVQDDQASGRVSPSEASNPDDQVRRMARIRELSQRRSGSAQHPPKDDTRLPGTKGPHPRKAGGGGKH